MSRTALPVLLIALALCGCERGEMPASVKDSPADRAGWIRVVNLTPSPINVTIDGQADAKPVEFGRGTDFRKRRFGPVTVGIGTTSHQLEVQRGLANTAYVLPGGGAPVMVAGEPRSTGEAGAKAAVVNLTSAPLEVEVGGGKGKVGPIGPNAVSTEVELGSDPTTFTAPGSSPIEVQAAEGTAWSVVFFGEPAQAVAIEAPRLVIRGAGGASSAGG